MIKCTFCGFEWRTRGALTSDLLCAKCEQTKLSALRNEQIAHLMATTAHGDRGRLVSVLTQGRRA